MTVQKYYYFETFSAVPMALVTKPFSRIHLVKCKYKSCSCVCLSICTQLELKICLRSNFMRGQMKPLLASDSGGSLTDGALLGAFLPEEKFDYFNFLLVP